MFREFSSPVDDTARVQKVQATRDVHRDLATSLVPPIFIQMIPRDGLSQITALQPGESEQQNEKPVADDINVLAICLVMYNLTLRTCFVHCVISMASGSMGMYRHVLHDQHG